MATKEECNICCEKFNKSTHLSISCEQSGTCEFKACKACIKTYLNGITADPNCMQCNKVWSDKFISKHLGASYIKGEYATHRKELLLQTQLARLSEAMPAVEDYKSHQLDVDNMKRLKEELAKTTDKIAQHQADIDVFIGIAVQLLLDDQIMGIQAEIDKLTLMKEDTKKSIKILQPQITAYIKMIKNQRLGLVEIEKKDEARKFIMPCGKTDCRGYLSTQYKCGLCTYYTCVKCFEVIGLKKFESEHVCKPENIESADFIRSQSKPCPACGTRISKIDGCNQMWCTQCRNGFDWNTGKIATGAVHNPHYFQYQQNIGGGAVVPLNPAAVPQEVQCGRLPDWSVIAQARGRLRAQEYSSDDNMHTAVSIYQLVGEFTDDINKLRRVVQAEQNYEHELVEYIVGDITREELANKIFKKDKTRKINTSSLYIRELFITIGIDLFNKIIVLLRKYHDDDFGPVYLTVAQQTVSLNKDLNTLIEEYAMIRDYCNEQFKEISMLYGVCVPYITQDWTSTANTKYNAKGGEIDTHRLKRENIGKEQEDTYWMQKYLTQTYT